MAAVDEHDWPSDDELLATIARHDGNLSEAAREIGIHRVTIRSRLDRRGLLGAVAAMRQEAARARGAADRERAAASSRKVTVDGDTATIEHGEIQLGDLETLIRERGLDPAEWVVVTATLNEWDGPIAGGGTQRLRQWKVVLRRAPRLILAAPAVDVAPLPARQRRRRAEGRPELIVVEGDHQAPYHHPQLDEAANRLLEDLQPAKHVLLGDLTDLPTISRHADHPAAAATVQECIQAAYGILRRRAEAAPNARRFMLKGNHEWRLEGELLARAERLYGIKPADTGEQAEHAALSLRRLLHLDALAINLVEDPRGWEHAEVELVPGTSGLVVRHGWLTGANSASRSLLKRGRSIIFGHGHRRQHVYAWDASAGLERQAVMAGTMSLARDRRFPHFAVADDWLQGLAIVTRWPDGEFEIEHARWTGQHLAWRDRRY